jgi:hypothetical protein
VKGLLADINIQGHLDLLVVLMKAEPWKLFWDHLQLEYFHFSDVDLAPDAKDSLIWETCQSKELVLITENRNSNDPDSLEATIKARNSPTRLPVLTIANVPHLRASQEYANRIIDTLIGFLLRIDALRGTGRLYLP